MNLGRSRPSIAYELQYRRELERLINEMLDDTEKEIRRLKPAATAQDAITISTGEVLKNLRAKWYRIFERRGRELFRWFAAKTAKRTRTQIRRKLQDAGFSFDTNYDSEDNPQSVADINAMAKENVALIKSIPQRFLRSVQKSLRRAVLNGGDWHDVYQTVAAALKPIADDAGRRAELITRDQGNKITQGLAVANAKEVGATKGRWIHVPGRYSSRITHAKMDRQEFSLDTGMFDPQVGRYVKPGELPYCNCQFEVLLPGFDE